MPCGMHLGNLVHDAQYFPSFGGVVYFRCRVFRAGFLDPFALSFPDSLFGFAPRFVIVHLCSVVLRAQDFVFVPVLVLALLVRLLIRPLIPDSWSFVQFVFPTPSVWIVLFFSCI